MKSIKISPFTVKHPVLLVILLTFSSIFILKSFSFFSNLPVRTFSSDARYKNDLLSRRNFLVHKLREGKFAVSEMPPVGDLFQGEWALVTASMTASALTNIAFRYPETREEAITAISDIIPVVLSKEYRNIGKITWGKDPLDDISNNSVQIWYLAHLNMTLSAYKLCGGNNRYDSLHRQINEVMIQSIEQSPIPYLETYPDEVYSADNSVMYASVKLYDKIYDQDHHTIFERWITYSKSNQLDPKTGIIKSYINDANGPTFNSRGSWVGWMSYYLPFIDEVFANDQYEKAKKHFFSTVLGFKVCREFPKGVNASGDIDSGPVIFGVSPSGTAFIVGGAMFHKDIKSATGFLTTAEFIGTSVAVGNKKHYLFSPLVGDAILLAMKTAVIWDNRYLQNRDLTLAKHE